MGLSFFSVRVYLGFSGFVQPFLIPESVKGLEKKVHSFNSLTSAVVCFSIFFCIFQTSCLP